MTAILAASTDSIALAESLSALVPAAVDGLVRQAIVVADRPGETMRALIDEAGVDFVEADGDILAKWRRGGEKARSSWLLLLEAGMTPTGNWADEVARFIDRADRGQIRPGIVAATLKPRSEVSQLASLRLMLDHGLQRLARTPPRAGGLVVRRDFWSGSGEKGRLRTLVLPAVLRDRRAGSASI